MEHNFGVNDDLMDAWRKCYEWITTHDAFHKLSEVFNIVEESHDIIKNGETVSFINADGKVVYTIGVWCFHSKLAFVSFKIDTDDEYVRIHFHEGVNLVYDKDRRGWGKEAKELMDKVQESYNEFVDYFDKMREALSRSKFDKIGVRADKELDELLSAKKELNEWLATNRTHEECVGCMNEFIMPSPCGTGHERGPVACPIKRKLYEH